MKPVLEKMAASRSLCAAAVCALLLIAAYAPAAAQAPETAQLNATGSLSGNLAALKGKTVTVTLAGGQSMTGTVKEVSGNLLHLEMLSQKEFYDGLVIIDRIAAIETRARNR